MLPIPSTALERQRAVLRARVSVLARIAIGLAPLAVAPAASAAQHRRHASLKNGSSGVRRAGPHRPRVATAAPGRAAPDLVRVQLSWPAVVDAPVGFHALAPSVPAGGAVSYGWFWHRDGSEVTTTTVPDATHVFKKAGSVLVTLLVTDSHGNQMRAHERVVVEAARRTAAGPGSRKHAVERTSREHARRGAVATSGHSATTATVAIKDFSFGPGTVTVHAGDTVTWVNEGPSSHTATAREGGGFDTGVLSRGQSASHIFTSPGTLSYICSIHPFMRATVVVLGSASKNSGSERSATSESPASSERAPASEHSSGSERSSSSSTKSGGQQGEPAAGRPQLPNTGMNLLVELLAGVGLVSLGFLLLEIGRRRRAPASAQVQAVDRATRR